MMNVCHLHDSMRAANPSDKVHLASGFTDGPWVILVTVLESKRRDTSCAKRNLNVEKVWNLPNIQHKDQ